MAQKTVKKKGGLFIKVLLVAFFTVILLACLTIGAIMAVVSKYSKDLPDVQKLTRFEPSESSQIFSLEGSLIGVLYKENRIWVSIKDIPQKMQEALIATEDARFYQHKGVDPVGITRAVYQNLKGGDISQGASTITQQLARNIFLSPERSIKRKIQEILLSLQIERSFSKKEILEYYLNQIYFGSGAYGIEAAAQTYFGRHARDLSLPECALIAGLPAAPSLFSPLVDEKAALERQDIVLKRMAICGFITGDEEKKARETKLDFAPKKSEFQMIKYPYFTTFALHELSQRYDDNTLYRGGLKIYTTLDLSMQKAAAAAIAEGLKRADKQHMNATNAALVAVDPATGSIRAMVGGSGYTEKNQFNRAWQARRLPGSAFKVFVYSEAIEEGYTPETVVEDTPVTYTIPGSTRWSPKNSDRRFYGPLTFLDSIKWSRNVCAVKVINTVGPGKVIDLAKKMGITDPLQPNLSLALGSSEVNVLDMASAYGVLAAGGKRSKPTAIRLITNSKGKVIEDNRKPKKEEVLSEMTAFTVTGMLEEVIKSGTGTAAQIGRPAAGKTGTTDDYRDAWFAGYVPQLSCAVWTGNDDSSEMNRVFGGTHAAGIWAAFMKKVLKGRPARNFGANDEDEIGVMICSDTGLRATGKCTDIRKDFFAPGKVPAKFCTVHGIRKLGDTGKKTPSPTPSASPAPTIDERLQFHDESPGPEESGTPGKNTPERATQGVPTLEPGTDGSPPAEIELPTEFEETPAPGEGEEGTVNPAPPTPDEGKKTPGKVEL
ncbi:MAG: PBP1A family penicillin-binding protein [Candidatus Eremiobacteraeota bacterium]|nr:PBP1A family penicillin-binding protein [Candidatus Eremiobacteraeota bacterium]